MFPTPSLIPLDIAQLGTIVTCENVMWGRTFSMRGIQYWGWGMSGKVDDLPGDVSGICTVRHRSAVILVQPV